MLASAPPLATSHTAHAALPLISVTQIPSHPLLSRHTYIQYHTYIPSYVRQVNTSPVLSACGASCSDSRAPCYAHAPSRGTSAESPARRRTSLYGALVAPNTPIKPTTPITPIPSMETLISYSLLLRHITELATLSMYPPSSDSRPPVPYMYNRS